jgi:glycosyltransferase involved in cell wall biosynthesis
MASLTVGAKAAEETPAVSVCIPAYKGAAFIASAIDSVLKQTFSDFELLVIDDHSPDDTAAIVAGYTDSRIRFSRNPRNLGPEGNWNRCLELARGRYVKLLPQDDLLAPECLARQVDTLAADTEQRLALVFCARTIINSTDKVLMRRGYPGPGGVIQSPALIRKCIRRGTNLIGEPGAVLFRKSTASKAGRFNGSIGFVLDLDYWFRLLRYGLAYYIPEPLAAFRVARGSWSVAIGAKQNVAFRNFIAKVAGDSSHDLTQVDIVVGNVMARANSRLRGLMYRLVVD